MDDFDALIGCDVIWESEEQESGEWCAEMPAGDESTVGLTPVSVHAETTEALAAVTAAAAPVDVEMLAEDEGGEQLFSQDYPGELTASTALLVAATDNMLGPDSSPPKRRRLLSKQTPEKQLAAETHAHSVIPDGRAIVCSESSPKDEASWWRQKNEQAKYDYVYNKLRRVYQTYVHLRQNGLGPRLGLPHDWPKSWSGLSEEEKATML